MENIKPDSTPELDEVQAAVLRVKGFADGRVRYLVRRGSKLERDAAKRFSSNLDDLAVSVEKDMCDDYSLQMAAEPTEGYRDE